MSNRNDPMAETVIEIPLADLYSFKNHPFKVQDDETMLETVESIRNYGVLVPGIVRPRPEGGYEIISGHRRKRASELAGKETMKNGITCALMFYLFAAYTLPFRWFRV